MMRYGYDGGRLEAFCAVTLAILAACALIASWLS